MFHHGCNSDGCHNKDSSDIEFADLERLEADDRSFCNSTELKDGRSVSIGHASCVEDDCTYIRDNNTEKDGDDLQHSPAPDVEEYNDSECNDCKEPVGLGIGDCRRCKAKTDTDDDRAGNNRRQEAHNLLNTNELDHERKQEVEKTGNNDTATCIRKLLTHGHVSVLTGAQICNSSESTKECEGGT